MKRSTLDLAQRVLHALDPAVVGELYCDFGGDAFWRERRERIVELGSAWGDALAARLRPGAAGRSVYVGGGVAEIPALLAEVVELDRSAVVANLRETECAVLEAAFAAAGVGAIDVVCADGREVVAGQRFDHLGLVSVLSDPETYPTVSGVGYGRIPPVLVDVDAFATERHALRGLVDDCLGALERPGWVTTSVEEVAWLLDWGARHDVSVVPDDCTLPTAIVEDPIGFVRVEGDADG